MVDAEFTALALEPLLGRPCVAVNLLRIARVGVHQHELAEVMQQRGDHQPVASLVVDLNGDPLGRALGRDAVQRKRSGMFCQTAVRSKKS